MLNITTNISQTKRIYSESGNFHAENIRVQNFHVRFFALYESFTRVQLLTTFVENKCLHLIFALFIETESFSWWKFPDLR